MTLLSENMEPEAGATILTSAARPRSRDYSIDLLKTLAIVGVLFIHTCTDGFKAPLGSFDWVSSVFWGSVVRWAVPVFFMCSGALLLRPGKTLTRKKLYGKSILRLLAALLFWAFAYKCFHLLSTGAFTLPALWQAVKETLLFNHEFHLYFLHIMLVVYVFLPVTRAFVGAADKKLLRYALILWFALGIFYPTVRPYWPFNLLNGIPAQWAINMTYSAIGYGLLGYYLKTYPLSRRWIYALTGAFGFLLTFIGTWALSLSHGELYANFLEGMSIGVCLMAYGVFGLCATVKKPLAPRLAGYMSKASFCIYLVHVFFLFLFAGWGYDTTFLPRIVSIPIFAFSMLACSIPVYALLSRIPWVKKWLI